MGPDAIIQGVVDQEFRVILRIVGVVAIIAGGAAFFAGQWVAAPPKPKSPKEWVNVCSGCGEKWYSMALNDPGPITKCPNCPMSEEEFESLKEQVRRRRSE
jgi:hypothetical protein